MENHEAAVVDPVEAGQKTDKELANHLASKANDGRLVKTDVDYTKEVDAAVSVAEKLLKENNLQGAVDALMPWEKKTRLSYDWKNNARIQTKIVEMCHLASNWTMLCGMVLALVRKRLAIKLALAKMIRAAFALIDKTPDEEIRFRLIDTLRIATANKIYVEVERARLTQMVADRKWKEGKKQEVAQMMLELHVETYSTMEIKERIRFLCEQIRMALVIGDVTRAASISKKVSTRYFDTHHESTSVQALKVVYYMLLIEIDRARNEHAEVSRHYRCLYETPILANSKEQATSVLRASTLYCLLSAHSSKQIAQIHWLIGELNYEPEYKRLVTKFLVNELISWNNDIKTNYEALLFQDSAEGKGVRVFANNDEGTARWATFKTRVAEHNMRVMSKYYSRIMLDRIANLLEMKLDDAEDFVCKIAVEKSTTGQIHRPSRIVSLSRAPTTLNRLDKWAEALNRLHNTINESSRLVSKEFTVHQTLFTATPMRQIYEKMTQEKAKISGVSSAQKSGSSENASSDQNPFAQQSPKPENQVPQNVPSQAPSTSTRTGIGKQNNSTQNQKK